MLYISQIVLCLFFFVLVFFFTAKMKLTFNYSSGQHMTLWWRWDQNGNRSHPWKLCCIQMLSPNHHSSLYFCTFINSVWFVIVQLSRLCKGEEHFSAILLWSGLVFQEHLIPDRVQAGHWGHRYFSSISYI